MSDKLTIKVVLYWHMHQPIYLDAEDNSYRLPWTYLHAIKDYVDMAAVIEQAPEGVRAVVNFVPTLLEQIDDYAVQVRDFLQGGAAIRDPLLAALAAEQLPENAKQRLTLIKACLRANEKRLINRFAPYRLLVDLYRMLDEKGADERYLSDRYLADLLVWYHLAWLGETVRRDDHRVQALLEKGHGYDLTDRRQLVTIIGELLASVIPRYRLLAEQQRVELSVTPYAHPIMPLLLDLNSTHEAMPGAPLPSYATYPGGEERIRWHIEEGNRVFEHYFGIRARGCWPSEGSVSEGVVNLLAEAGYDWIASGESVMHNSRALSGLHDGECIHHPYRLEGADTICFFRDDNLSDSIGFNYAEWHADDAVNNLIHHLENIAQACVGETERVVPIILDGENAWESYPENGYYFLSTLYKKLVKHKQIKLTTFSDCLDEGCCAQPLNRIVAGSWVYGTFSTWIGDAEKNRGWDLLIEAKQAFDRVVRMHHFDDQQRYAIDRQLAICEGSDWFWWFGDYNPSDSVRDFDHLYRLQLKQLYRLLGESIPEALSLPISRGGGAPAAGGVMRRGNDA